MERNRLDKFGWNRIGIIGMRVGWNVDSGKNDTNILPEEISVFVEYD